MFSKYNPHSGYCINKFPKKVPENQY